MAHTHSVYDTDTHFIIDAETREITTETGNALLIQHDHNSERFTFELPRYIDGHDMSLCNLVQVHYLNIDVMTKEQYQGIYRVDDLQVDQENSDIVTGSWLVSSNATQFVGALHFVIRFACAADDGTIDYDWHTAIYRRLTVGAGINNTEIIAEQYADIVAQWESELKALDISVLNSRVASAIKSTNMVLKDSDTQLNGDYNNLTPNAIYTIAANISAENAPYNNFRGQIHVFDFNTTRGDSSATTVQVAYSSAGRMLYRILFAVPRQWTDWVELRGKNDFSNILHGYKTMITSDANATGAFGNDYNNLPENSIICIGYPSTTAQNIPYSKFTGNVICASYCEGKINGKTQIAISGTNRMLHRIKWGVNGNWTDWVEHEPKPKTYYVGGDSEHQNLTQLFIDLADDTSPKTIYINPGVYDIYQEYRDLEIPTPPDDVTSSDYLTRCVFVPPNTKLIGIGNVTLEWKPSKDSITLGESRTWSPLNVRYACHIENISIHCKYGRYCIHDDSHNAVDDQCVTHTYKNVRCVYEYSDGGYGFNNALGFGFSQKNNYIFEDCRFEIITNGNNSAFYGHSSSGTALNADESPSVTVKNCIIVGGSNNNRVVRLQSLNKSPLKIKTLFEGCYIDGGIYLTLYYDDAIQAFDVTLLKSGNPIQTIDQSDVNPYSIKIYE